MKSISVALCLALILAAPGLTPYQAAAQVVRVAVEAPVGAPNALPLPGTMGLRTGASPMIGGAELRPGSALPGLGPALPGMERRPESRDPAVAGPAASLEFAPAITPVAAEPAVPAPDAAQASVPGTESLPTPSLRATAVPAGPAALAAAPEESRLNVPAVPAGHGLLAGKPRGIGARFKALLELFAGKKAEALPVAAAAAANPAAGGETTQGRLSSPEAGASTDESLKAAPPAPSQAKPPQDDRPSGSSWLGLGRTAVFFILALVFGQVGIEALGASLPGLMEKAFGDVTKLAEITIFASLTNIVGRTLGVVAVERFGLKKTYIGATALRVLSISGLAALLATGTMTWPLMIAFYSLNGLLGGIAMTAETSIPPAIFGSDPVRLEKFWTWEQTLLEIVGVTGPIATGAVVASLGFLPALIAFPVSFAVAIAILLFSLRIPAKLEAMGLADKTAGEEMVEGRQTGDRTKPKGIGGVFKEFFAKMARGAKVVWRDPLLKAVFLAFTAYMILNPMLYTMLAPNFGMRLLGPAGENLYTSVIGMLTGLYSLGGLLGGFLMMAEQRRIGRLKEPGPASGRQGISDDEERELLRRSMIRWMKWGTAGLAAVATMAFPIPMLGTLVALPSWLAWLGTITLPALALIPFGIAQVVSTVKLKSYFQSKAKPSEMADAMGFFGSASLAASTAAILALKFLFKGVAGFTPFVAIAIAMIPLAIAYIHLTRRVDSLSKPATEPGNPRSGSARKWSKVGRPETAPKGPPNP